jgi:hypothetical protein
MIEELKKVREALEALPDTGLEGRVKEEGRYACNAYQWGPTCIPRDLGYEQGTHNYIVRMDEYWGAIRMFGRLLKVEGF